MQAALLCATVQASALLAFIPLFGERLVAVRNKVAILIAFIMLLFPLHLDTLKGGDCTSRGFEGLPLNCIVIGLVVGAVFRGIVLAMIYLSSIVANLSSIAQPMVPEIFTNAESPISRLTIFAMLYALADFDLYAVVVELSNRELSITCNSTSVIDRLVPIFHLLSSYAMSIAFKLSIPFIFFSLLYNFSIGIANRSMPSLMVMFIGAPFLLLATFYLLREFTPLYISLIEEIFSRVQESYGV